MSCLNGKKTEVAQLCPTLRDPMDCSLPGSSVHGILQARVLEWVAVAFLDSVLSKALCTCAVSHLSATLQLRLTLCDPMTVAHRLLCLWDSAGRNTAVGCRSLLQGNVLTQGSNLRLLCFLH